MDMDCNHGGGMRRMGFDLVCWFSGSGNARRLADRLADLLHAEGRAVRSLAIERPGADAALPDQAERLFLVTAVYGFGLPERVGAFLDRLPAGVGRPAFVLAAIGNEETLRVGPLAVPLPPTDGVALLDARRRLARRGYAVRASRAVEMPNSWFLPLSAPDEETCARLYADSGEALRSFVAAVGRGNEEHPPARPAMQALLGLIHILYLTLGRRQMGLWFCASRACTGCGRCARDCPAGVIRMASGRPRWGYDCQGCFRCANRCPERAVEVSGTMMLATLALTLFGARLLRPLLARRSRMILEFAAALLSLPALALLHGAVNGRGPFPLPALPVTANRRRYTAGWEEEAERGRGAGGRTVVSGK